MATIKGVSAIQHSQSWLNGGKHAAQRSPLITAASHGQNRPAFRNQFTPT